MSLRPDLINRSVSNAEYPKESRGEVASVFDEESVISYLASPRIQSPVVPDMGGVTTRHRADDVCFLAGTAIMLLWPWVFSAIIWFSGGGIPLGDRLAKIIKLHPEKANFFITLLGNILNIIVSIMFSTVVIRFSQEWATNNHVTVFDISLISGLRYQKWPWRMKDRKYLLIRNRWFPAVLAGVCITAFALVPSGMTSLITPVPFIHKSPLVGAELNFSSSDDDCLDWFKANPLPNECNRKRSFSGIVDIGCLDPDQLVDLLETGRNSILSWVSNNSESVILEHLSANYSLRFLGPSRGVLPIGPNGVHNSYTLQPSLLSDVETNSAIVSYNYTLHHQGLTGNVNCSYDTQSPIRFGAVPDNTGWVAANASCNDIGLGEILTVQDYLLPNTSRTLSFWACKSKPTGEQDPAYHIYLRGGEVHQEEIGNITCTVSPMQLAVFSVMYQSSVGAFLTQEQTTASTPINAFSDIIEYAILALGSVLHQAQIGSVNLVDAMVNDLAFQTLALFKLQEQKKEQYLPLYNAMLQGIIMDQITYMRFLYSTVTAESSPPASCIRTVNGMVNAEVTGWVAKPVHFLFLMPMTLLNLVSFIIMGISMAKANRICHEFGITDLRSLVLAECSIDGNDPSGWADGVSYRSRESVMIQTTTRKSFESK